MSKYLVYDLRAVEDLKLTRTNMQIDTHDTMDYVSGSAIRGAFIYKYIRANDVGDINVGESRQKLLAGGIKFLNAYPVYQNCRGIPWPNCYFAPKEKIKTFKNEINISLGLDKVLPAGYEKIKELSFAGLSEDSFFKIKTEKVTNLHINKRTEKNKLFRYEAIKKQQLFKGIIKVEKDEYAEEVKELLNNQTIYIGGSKGSGYGKCKIEKVRLVEENPELGGFVIDEDKGYFYLIALSDIIYKDQVGAYKTKIEETFLAESMDLKKVEFIDSSIETKNVTGFNNKWNARTPNIVAIKAGSVFKYKFSGKLNKALLNLFIDSGVGERKADGFGRIAITTELMATMLYNKGHAITENIEKSVFTEQEKLLLEKICNQIYKKRVVAKTSEAVLKLNANLHKTNALKNSQWGNLKDLFANLAKQDVEEGKKAFREFMDHVKANRATSLKQMENVKYRIKGEKGAVILEQKLIEFFEAYLEGDKQDYSFDTLYADCRVELGNVSSNPDKEFTGKMKFTVLSELCRYEIRKEAE